LKALLAHTILQRREAILVDLAAGLEFMGRACVQGVDAVVVVVEPGARSIETAVNIARMAGNMGIEHVAAFANKITDPGQIDIIRSQLAGIPILGSFRLEPALSAADLNRLPVVDASNELVRELKKAKEAMANLFFQERVSQN
jgi:CO dehydrogenase maturation factor